MLKAYEFPSAQTKTLYHMKKFKNDWLQDMEKVKLICV